MNRAVAISDAYYGDQSSVLQVYQKTGKPMMLQSPSSVKASIYKGKLPASECFVEKDGYFWFVPMEDNILYRYHIGNRTLEYVTCFPEEKISNLLFSSITVYEDKLFFAPDLADYIYVYNIGR